MALPNDRYGSQSTGTTPSSSKMSTMANTAGDQLADAAGQAQQVAQEQLDKLADAIRRKPIQATGIAAGVGFLLALLARK